MPRRKIDWIFLTKLNSEVDLENFFKQYPKQSSGHANSNNCTLCSDNSDCHKMVVLYPKCKCQNNCITRYLITKCQKIGQIVVKGVNMHPILNHSEIQTQAKKNKHGISVKYKEIIENLIYRNISKPYHIYQHLLLNHNGDLIPKLTQIQSYMKYRRMRDGDVNSIEGLKEFVSPKVYENIELSNLAEDEPIYFGSEINEGDDSSHFHLGITTKKLLNNALNVLTFHFDCTYKIVKYGFPVAVFGGSDIRRKFYPISFFITSHEKEEDFTFFWQSLIEIGKRVNINFIDLVEYICIDADRASSNSIKHVLINSKIIMCWYHLKANINKNSNKIPKSCEDEIVNNIIHLKSTKNQESFEKSKKKYLTKWKKNKHLNDFVKYFTKQWLSEPFCNWQLFQTPPGYAMSNNPIESYNNKIKRFFTERTKFNLLPVFEIFEKVVKFESRIEYVTPICSYAKLSTKKEAKKYLESITKLEEEKENDEILLKYKWSDKYFVEINPNCFCPDCTHCSCCQFLDSAVCIHLVGCCYLDSIGFPGIILKKFRKKNSSQKRKVGPWHEKD